MNKGRNKENLGIQRQSTRGEWLGNLLSILREFEMDISHKTSTWCNEKGPKSTKC